MNTLAVLLLAAAVPALAEPSTPATLTLVVDASYVASNGYGHVFRCPVRAVLDGELRDPQITLSTVAGAALPGALLQEGRSSAELRVTFSRIPARPAALMGFVDAAGAVWKLESVTQLPPAPPHLKEPPSLSARAGERIVAAPPGDTTVARTYPWAADKGRATRGLRLTLLTARRTVRVGEEVRVIHVLEAVEPGHDVYVMGPKPVTDEYVDGVLVTPRWKETAYDGVVLKSPAADFNYEVTTYRFVKPGEHTIVWKGDPGGASLGVESNTLRIVVK